MCEASEFDSIVISGGGSRGIVALGILYYHHCITERLKMANIKHIAGTSIGSAISLLLVCGYSPRGIYNKMKMLLANGTLFMGDATKTGALSGLLNVYTNEGLLSLDRFGSQLETLVLEKLKVKVVPTMKELYELSGIHLSICVSNVTLMKELRIDHITEPNLSVAEAVKMSCAVPIVFQKMSYKGNCVADGGLVNNFPWRYVPEKGNILGVLISDAFTTKEATSMREYDNNDEKPDAFLTYIYNVMLLPMASLARLQRMNAYTSPNMEIIRAIWNRVHMLRFSLTEQEMKDMFDHGVKTAYIATITVKLFIEGIDSL